MSSIIVVNSFFFVGTTSSFTNRPLRKFLLALEYLSTFNRRFSTIARRTSCWWLFIVLRYILYCLQHRIYDLGVGAEYPYWAASIGCEPDGHDIILNIGMDIRLVQLLPKSCNFGIGISMMLERSLIEHAWQHGKIIWWCWARLLQCQTLPTSSGFRG